MNTIRRVLPWATLAAALTADWVIAAEIKLVEAPSTCFGGSEFDVPLEIAADGSLDAVVRWSHMATPNRPLSRGEQIVRVSATMPLTVPIRLRVPPVRDGVIWSSTLHISLKEQGRDQPLGSVEKMIWIFPRDPFFNRREQMRWARIVLYDPAGSTAQLLDNIQLPHRRIQNVSMLDEMDHGLALIGEGISLQRQAGLADAMLRAAKRGVDVICLAPSEGVIAIASRHAIPPRLVLKQNDAITDLDKRLDSSHWTGVGPPPSNRFELVADEREIMLSVGKGALSWPWCEVHFGEHQQKRSSRITFCGYRIVEHWHSGPTPRYLLARLIDRSIHVDRQTTEKIE